MKVRRCAKGHRITGANVLRYLSRGNWLRRCRRCKTDYMRAYMRRRRRAGRA